MAPARALPAAARRRLPLALLIAIASPAAAGSAALAHDLEVFWTVEGNSLRIEVVEDGDAPAAGAAVAIRSAAGASLAAGETDAGGRRALPLPGELPFWIEASHGGHRVQVKVDDLSRPPRRTGRLERILRVAAGALAILALGGIVLMALRLRRANRRAPGN